MKVYEETDFQDNKKIKQGYQARVYPLNEDKVIKFYYKNFESVISPVIDLQGLPFIPKVYDVNHKEKYIIQERIEGVYLSLYLRGYTYYYHEVCKADLTNLQVEAETFFRGLRDRGYIPDDFHAHNMCFDEDGKLWIFDVGRFTKGEFEFNDLNDNTLAVRQVKGIINQLNNSSGKAMMKLFDIANIEIETMKQYKII